MHAPTAPLVAARAISSVPRRRLERARHGGASVQWRACWRRCQQLAGVVNVSNTSIRARALADRCPRSAPAVHPTIDYRVLCPPRLQRVSASRTTIRLPKEIGNPRSLLGIAPFGSIRSIANNPLVYRSHVSRQVLSAQVAGASAPFTNCLLSVLHVRKR